jgi:transposase
MTQKKRYRRYSPEFKREALLRTSEEGITDKQVCLELGISARQLARWRDELRLLGDQAFPGKGHSRDEEITQLKRELAKMKQERDFLKEAAVFFAKESK